MAALFGGSSGSSRREPRSLVEFRAGKMQLSGTTVTADARKGLIYMKLDDGLVHFYWKDRKNSKVVDVRMLSMYSICTLLPKGGVKGGAVGAC